MAQVPLGSGRLCGLGAAMFPLNANVAAVCGGHAARVVCLDPVAPQSDVVRQVCAMWEGQMGPRCPVPMMAARVGSSVQCKG